MARPGKEEDSEIIFLTNTYMPMPNLAEMSCYEHIELDLGCGVGSFTSALAKSDPSRLILAADVMVGRLRKLAKKCRLEEIKNMKIYRTEARHLLAVTMPDRLLDRLHLLCPDPWPKGRHRGHRLLTSDFVVQIHRVLKTDGVFHFSSDDDYYFDAVKRVIMGSNLFKEVDADPTLADIRSDFERRWLDQGKAVRHVYFQKLPLPPKTIGH